MLSKGIQMLKNVLVQVFLVMAVLSSQVSLAASGQSVAIKANALIEFSSFSEAANIKPNRNVAVIDPNVSENKVEKSEEVMSQSATVWMLLMGLLGFVALSNRHGV